MRIVAIANQKGGVGKTTTTVNLGACLAELGKRVLIIDLDPQANATSALGLSPDEHESIYHSLIHATTIDHLLTETRYANLTILPSDMDLAGCEIELARGDDHLVRLRHVLHHFRNHTAADRFDFILLDCPPSLGVLMTSALAAADELLVPLQCEYLGLEGLSKIVQVTDQVVYSGANPDLKIEGIVMTMADKRTNLSQLVISDVRTHFQETVYNTVVPRGIRLGEAPSFGQAITEYAPTSSGAKAYRELAEEFLARREPPVADTAPPSSSSAAAPSAANDPAAAGDAEDSATTERKDSGPGQRFETGDSC